MLERLKITFYDNSGFALLELVISMSLLTIILALGFLFYTFMLTTFDTGERQTDVQQNARLVGDSITDKTRIAERMIIIDDYDGKIDQIDVDPINEVIEGGIEDDEYLYFIYLKEGSIYYQKIDDLEDPSTEILMEDISNNIEFELDFAVSEGEKNILSFDLSARDKETNRTYSMDKEVLILNLDEIEDESDGTGKAVFYQIPAPPDPSIRSLRLDRYNHVYSSETSEIPLEITVYTSNVPDAKEEEVAVNFYGLDQEGNTEDVGIEQDKAVIEDDQAELNLEGLEDLCFGYYIVEAKSVEDTFAPQRRYYYIEPDISLKEFRRIGSSRIQDIEIKMEGIPEDEQDDMDVIFENTNNGEGDILLALLDDDDQFVDIDEVIHGPTLSDGILEIRYRLGEGVDIRKTFNLRITIADTIEWVDLEGIEIDIDEDGEVTITIPGGLEEVEEPVDDIELVEKDNEDNHVDYTLIDVDTGDEIEMDELEVIDDEINFRIDLDNEEDYGKELILRVWIEDDIISETFEISND